MQIWLTVVALMVIGPLGLLSKVYDGPGREWVNDSSGDVLSGIFLCLLVALPFRDWKTIRMIPWWVFGVACVIEFSQLWHEPTLVQVRSTVLGRLLLGNTFSWLDFPHYAAGCVLGAIMLRQLRKSDR